NYRSLAVSGVRQQSAIAARPDTAALAAIVALQWDKALPELNGIFAFGAWDSHRQQLLLARDHLGVKPLYWAQSGQTLLFASEVRALLKSKLVPCTMDWRGLSTHLLFGAPIEPHTMVEGVRAIQPGGSLIVGRDLIPRETRWWSLPAAVSQVDEQAARGALPSELDRAISGQMLADVPVGILLSGGVDSTGIAALAARMGFRPLAISLFLEESPLNEEAVVVETCKRFGMELHASRLTAANVVDTVPDWIAAQDQPSVDGLNVYLVSRAAHEAGLKVVLSGNGGDEVFCGYQGFARARRAAQLERRMRAMRTVFALARTTRLSNPKAARLLDMFAGVLPSYYVSRSLRGTTELRSLLRGGPLGADALPERARAEFAEISAEPSAVRRMALLETSFYLRNVLLRDADQMGMAHSLEIRVPLLDWRLAVSGIAALGSTFPPPDIAKPLFVDAIADDNLSEVSRLPKKGFDIPLSTWMRSRSGFDLLRSLGESADATGAFEPGAVTRSIDRFSQRRESAYSALAIVTAVQWMKRNGVSV
ncbi:MAG TPA: asparagine synthetase B, partial [Gemmatimonadaceae bacterium]|nr:asparagine synthetase B [Gemmatimonadaceae bacterium]